MTDEPMIDRIKDVQARYSRQLMEMPHVIGVSIGQREPDEDQTGDYVLVVLVDQMVDEDDLTPSERIPDELDGVPVIVRQIGTFEAL
jgi:hypothetical protein